MSHVAIQVESLGKRYRIGGRERHVTLRERLTHAMKSPMHWFNSNGISGPATGPRHIWALRNVSFELQEGEVLGLIGRNGAGKTTLMKILSRVTQPTEGSAEIRGRVGSLLEVGTGFHPELTGRENTYLNGAILGMGKKEIERKFDDIVAFAEVADFIDTPLKHYSTGMQMRLAFAVAAHFEPQILLVDEVLAVGDMSFQKKCLGKMGEVARAGRTVVLVSHNLGAITRLCPRCIWMEGGTIKADGPSTTVVNQYQSEGFSHRAQWIRPVSENPNGGFKFTRIGVKSEDGTYTSLFNSDQPIFAEIEYEIARSLSGCQIGSRIVNSEGLVIFSTSDADHLRLSAAPKEPGRYRAVFQIPANLLAPGPYSMAVGAHLPGRNVYDMVDQAVIFEITAVSSLASLDGRLGVVTPLIHWETTEDVTIEG